MKPLETAESYPRGAVVLSTDGTDRTSLHWAVLTLGALIFAAGTSAGYLVARSKKGR